MNVNDYKLNAARTMSNEWHLSIFDTEQLHCAIGMVTEFGEILQAIENPSSVDKVNVMEEVGDVLWYLAGLQRYYTDCDWEEVESTGYSNLAYLVNAATVEAIEVLDAYKKFAYYGKPLKHESQKSKMYFIYRCCSDILKHTGHTMEECRQINIDKLKARFPDKFTSENANTRNLAKEREILEGKQ